MVSKIIFTLALTYIFQPLIFAQDIPVMNNRSNLSIGEIFSFRSAILNEERSVNIYLPYGYSKDSLKTYPVIYLLDGSINEDFIHISGLVQFGSFSWINMIPESIVVGIANVDRKKDYTYPSHNKLDQEDFPTSGGSAKFMQFLELELQPLIKQNYNTSSTTTLIGQSLGGLLATEILFKQPDLFNNYIIVSPSLWWDDEALLNYSPVPYDSKKSIYIAVGKEGEVMERTARELYDKLNVSRKQNTLLYYKYLENQDHGDALHLAVYDAFEKMFRDQ